MSRMYPSIPAFVFCAVLALTAADCGGDLSAETGKPKTPSMRIEVRAAGAAVRVLWTVAATPPVDSQVVSVTGPTAVRRKYTVLSKTDSVDYAKPAPGATIGGGVTDSTWKGLKSAKTGPITWSYTEPDTLPPAPPSVTVRSFPTSATIAPTDSLVITARVS